MPAAHPEEFAAVRWSWPVWDKPIGQIARDVGISESCLRRWMGQADRWYEEAVEVQFRTAN